MTWWRIFKQEIRMMFIKDPRRASFIFGAPIIYLFLFSMLYGSHVVKNVPLVVCDEDQTQLSRLLIQSFDDSERFRIVGFASSQEEMEQYIQDKEAFGALYIPAKFSQDIKAGRSSSVLIIANAANLLITNTITTTAQEIVMAFSKDTGAILAEKAGLMPIQGQNRAEPIQFTLRVLNNPTLSYLDFFVIGLAMAAFQQGIFLSLGASIICEYRNHTRLTTIVSKYLLVGKLLPYELCGVLAFSLVLGISNKIFDIPCKGNFFDLLLISLAFTFTAIGFSSLMATFCDNEVSFTKLSLIYTVPAFILSGHIWPQYSMNVFTQLFSYTFPIYYFADTVRDLMIVGYSPFLYRKILILLCLGIVCISAAQIMLKKRAKISTEIDANFGSHR